MFIIKKTIMIINKIIFTAILLNIFNKRTPPKQIFIVILAYVEIC